VTNIDIHRTFGRLPGASGLLNVILAVRRALLGRIGVKAVASVMVIRAISLCGNVFSGLLTAAFLGPDGRGEQAAMILAPTVLTPLCTFGLHASLVYSIRSDPEHGSRYFGAALILTCIAGLGAAGLGYLLIPTWLGHYSAETVSVARLLLVAVPIGVVTPSLMAVLEANGHFVLASSTLYIGSLGTAALLGMLAASGWLTAMSAAVAYVIPAVPTLIYLMVHAWRVIRPMMTMATPYPQRLLRYGLQFYGVDILGVLSGYLDQVVIVFLLQPAAVGAYVVAISLSRVLFIAQGAVSTVLFPSIAALEPTVVVDMVARATRITTLVNTAGAMGLAIVGPWLLLLLYGTRFSAAVVPFLILLAEAVVTSAARTLSQAFSGTGRPSMVTVMEGVGVGASFAAMLIVVPAWGIVGAACCTLLGGVVRLACVMASFRRFLGVGLPRLVISRADFAWMAGR